MTNSNYGLKLSSVAQIFCCVALIIGCMWTADVNAQGGTSGNQITRAQFLAMSDAQKVVIANNNQEYQISDLVNATPAHLQDRLGGVIYLSVADFNNASPERRVHVLNNPESYIVVADSKAIPKQKISRQEVNALAPDKQKLILESGDFQVID